MENSTKDFSFVKQRTFHAITFSSTRVERVSEGESESEVLSPAKINH
jgi:hypothetical protein